MAFTLFCTKHIGCICVNKMLNSDATKGSILYKKLVWMLVKGISCYCTTLSFNQLTSLTYIRWFLVIRRVSPLQLRGMNNEKLRFIIPVLAQAQQIQLKQSNWEFVCLLIEKNHRAFLSARREFHYQLSAIYIFWHERVSYFAYIDPRFNYDEGIMSISLLIGMYNYVYNSHELRQWTKTVSNDVPHVILTWAIISIIEKYERRGREFN